MIFDFLYRTFLEGGVVMGPILCVGMVAFYLLFEGFWKLGGDLYRRDFETITRQSMRALRPSHREEREQFSQNLLEKRGYFAPFFGAILQKNYRTQEELVQEIRLLAHNTSVKMNRNLQMIGVLATTAPLLGLLGTVTGMVTTFEIITEYGNGNPVLLAGGISEALITTQSGLLIAFPILLLHNRLEDRNQWVLKRMEHAATRLIWRATQGGYYGSL